MLWNRRTLGILLALAGWMGCGMFALLHRHDGLFGIDFRSVYSSSRCMIDNCNPYDPGQTMAEFLRQGGMGWEAGSPAKNTGPFVPYYAGYPPTTLFYLMPLALLHWRAAWFLFWGIGFTMYGAAVYLFAKSASRYSVLGISIPLGLFVLMEEYILRLAQPALWAVSLCCIGLWCLLERRHTKLGIFCLALSITLKPHLGVPIILYFLLANKDLRKDAFRVIATTVALCLPALVWAAAHTGTRHWLRDYSANIKGMSSVGHLSYPGASDHWAFAMTHLQTITGLYRDEPSFFNHTAWAVSAVLFLAWLYPVMRLKPGREKDLVCIAAIACFSMLPMYHRAYDTRLLLVAFPAFALLLRKSRLWAVASIACSLLLAICSPGFYGDPFSGVLHPSDPDQLGSWSHHLYGIPFQRPAAASCFVVTVFFLTALYLCRLDTEDSLI
jgi:hypothetical protein